MVVQSVREAPKANVGRGKSNRFWDSMETYISWHDVEGHTVNTQDTYRRELRPFIRFLEDRGHSLRLESVTSMDVLNHLKDMKDRGLRPRSVRSRRVAILSFFNWAESWNLIPDGSNPCHRIKPPKVPKDYKPFITPEAFDKLLSLCDSNTFTGARRTAMLWLLVTTGIRHNELFSLTLDDVNWQKKTIRVRLGKGQKTRAIPMTKQTHLALLRYTTYRGDESPALWVRQDGLPLGYYGISQDIKRLMERAGVAAEVKDTLHIFRRTFGARAITEGIPREYIQVVGGWDNAEMLDHYAQGLKMESNEALEAFQDFDPFRV